MSIEGEERLKDGELATFIYSSLKGDGDAQVTGHAVLVGEEWAVRRQVIKERGCRTNDSLSVISIASGWL